MRELTDTHEAVASEPRTTAASQLRGRNGMTRYWGEIVVVVFALLVWAPRLSGPIDLRWDAGVYYLLGTSLSEGHGYRIASEPGSPEAVQYPPLLPAVVALHQWVLGTSNPHVVAPWLRKSYAAMFIIYSLAVLALARRYLSTGFAVTATVLCLVQVMTVFMSDLLHAELPFALASVAFALVAADPPLAARSWLHETASFSLAAAGFLLRTAGLALLVAWVLEAVVRRHWRRAVVRGLVAIVPVLAWQAYVARVHGSYEYSHPAYEYQRAPYQFNNVTYAENASLVDPFRPELGHVNTGGVVRRLATNTPKLLAAIGQGISTREDEWRRLVEKAQVKAFRHVVIPRDVALLPIYGFAALVLSGLVILLRRGAWLMLFVVLGSVGLIWITPWPGQFIRYLSPINPFLTIAAILALCQIPALLRTRQFGQPGFLARIIPLVVLMVMFAVATFTTLRFFRLRARAEGVAFPTGNGETPYRLFAHDRAWQAWEETVNWIHAKAPSDAVVATSAPHFCYLCTGIRANFPPMDADAERAERLLAAVPTSYVIIDELGFVDISRRYAKPAVERDPARWRLIHSVGATKTYARTGSADDLTAP